MSNLTKNQNFAVQVRKAIVHATQTHGTSGYPEIEYTEPPFLLRLAQAEDGSCWYCPFLFGIQLTHLLKQARHKKASI